MFNCRYRTDSATGKLVCHNGCPEYVEKMYHLKSFVLQRNISNDRLWNLICMLECRLFQNDGELFEAWLYDGKEWIETDVRVIEKNFNESACSEITPEDKEEILSALREFIV